MTDKIVLKLEEGVKIRAANQKPVAAVCIRTSNGLPVRSVAQSPLKEGVSPRPTAQSPQTTGQSASTSGKSQKD